MASIKQLDERRYKITVSNGYRPNGKKISKAKTIQVPPGVPKRGIGQYVAHAAEELERSFKTGYAEDGEMTFEEFASRWLKRQTKYAPSTIAAYRRMLEVVYPIIGGIRLNKLRPMALENMLSVLRKRKHHGKRINESTAQRYLSVVSAVLSDAKRNEIVEKNPARMLDLPTPQRTVQRIPTRGEVEKLLDALAKEPRHYRLFYLLSMYTGCRRGELCALQWSDFNGTQNGLLLTVSRSRSSVPGKGIVEGSTKNGKSREVYLSSDLRGILLAYKRRKQMEADKQRRRLSPYLFTDEQGAAHPPGHLYQAAAENLCRHRLSAGVPSAHPAALLRDIAAALRRGQADGGRPRRSCGHRLLRAHLLPPPAGAEGAGGRLHAHHAPSGRRTDLQSRRRLFSEAAQRMIVAFVEIHFSKKIVIALPPRLRYVVLAK